MKPLNTKDIKRLNEALSEQFGIKEPIKGVFFDGAKDKVYWSTKEIERVPLDKMHVDTIGMYFGTWMKDGLRLSIDGSQKIARIATKGTLELTREDWESWLKGQDMDTELPEAYYLIIYEGDCYGCAKASKGKLLNYVPKARRLSVINA